MRCFLNALGSAHPRAARRTLPVMGIVSHWRGSCSFWPWPSFLRVLLLPALPALQDDLANVGMDLCFESVEGLGKLAVTLDSDGRDFVLVSKFYRGFRLRLK